ncbi:hypothetical protein N665_1263s0013, partial [Sinapis alba]
RSDQPISTYGSDFHGPKDPSGQSCSRITTVIRVVVTIKQTITDLMSHSQFHSLNLFILTHAWLNL